MWQKLLHLIQKLFNREPEYNGVVLEIDPELAQYDLLFLGGEIGEEVAAGEESFDWEPYAPEFHDQGRIPTCLAEALRNIKATIQNKLLGVKIFLSSIHLFFKGGGTTRGSSVSGLGNILVRGEGIEEKEKPYPSRDLARDWNALKRYALNVDKQAMAAGKHIKIDGYSYVNPSVKRWMIDAMEKTPLILIVRLSSDYSNDYVFGRGPGGGLHAVELLHINNNGNYRILDSLQYRLGFNGRKTLDKDYPYIVSAYSVRDLPDDWKALQEKAAKETFGECLNHYGLKRDFAKEQEVAGQMVKEFEKFNSQSVWEAAGRFWTVYINAIVYGNYTLSYYKHGRWLPGDVINDCYQWRRSGEHIFEFNRPKPDKVVN